MHKIRDKAHMTNTHINNNINGLSRRGVSPSKRAQSCWTNYRPLVLSCLIVSAFCLSAGCLGDNRCGSNQRQEEERCISLIDASLTETDDGLKTCAYHPVAADLVDQFTTNALVGPNDCPPGFIAEGDVFSSTFTYKLEGEKIIVSFSVSQPLPLDIAGVALIEKDGRVTSPLNFDMMGMILSLDNALCFKDRDSGTATALMTLSQSTGLICEFITEGDFLRTGE